MSTSSSSVSFVITAIYTVTFANGVYRIVDFSEEQAELIVRPGTTWVEAMCMLVCLTMALRFFFGNNNYVDTLFAGTVTARKRLYHLSVIVLQSLLLLGSSYLIRNPPLFFVWISVLFLVEVLWYAGCVLLIPEAIRRKDGGYNRSLAVNEVANVFMVIGASVAAPLWFAHARTASILLAVFFVANTLVDLKVNFNAYMGIEELTST